MKKSLFYVSVLSFAMFFTGCSVNKVKPDEIVKVAVDKLGVAESYKMVMEIKADSGGDSEKMNVSIDRNTCTKPKKMVESINKMEVESFDQVYEVEFKQYVVENQDKTFTNYINLNNQWQKTTVKSIKEAGIQDAQEQIRTYLELGSDYKLVGEKDINNVKCYEVDLKIPYKKSEEVLESIYSMSNMDISTEKNIKVPEGDFVVKFFISKEDQNFVGYSIDLSEFIKLIGIHSRANEEDIKEIFFSVDIILQDINSVEAITIPEEALELK